MSDSHQHSHQHLHVEKNFFYNNFEKNLNNLGSDNLDSQSSSNILSNQIKLIYLTPEKLFSAH